jgi:DNA-binding PadR family transcriptional regulator
MAQEVWIETDWMSRGIRRAFDVDSPGTGPSLAEFAMLGLLSKGSMHGYDIARQFAGAADLGLVLPLEQSTVYAVLKDLQRRGLIEGQQETIGKRPPRMVFSLTPNAVQQLLRWLETPVDRLREIRSSLLVKLYFCRDMDDDATLRLLDAQIHASSTYLHELLDRQHSAEPESFAALVCASKVGAARATLSWLKEERARAATSTNRAPARG